MDDPRGVESSAIMVEAAPEPRRPSKRQSLVQFFTGAKAEAAPPKRHSKTSVLEMWGVIDEAEAHMTRRKQTHRTSFFVREPGETPDWLDGRRLSVRHEHDPTFSIEDDFGEGGEDDVHTTRRALPRHLLDDGFVIPSFDAAGLADVSEAPVGRGSQAAVFRCRVPFGRRAGETFALKVLRKELAFLDDECAAFVREVHFLGRIRHEHVCETLGCGTTRDNLPCLLLSWCETDVTRALELREVGGDDGAARRVRLAWPSLERLRLLSEFASALDFLHSGAAIPATVVLHRDLKPDNLGLTDAGQLKLLDFGLAVALRKDTNRATGRYELTGGTGSRRYMAPEICRDLPYGVAARVPWPRRFSRDAGREHDETPSRSVGRRGRLLLRGGRLRGRGARRAAVPRVQPKRARGARRRARRAAPDPADVEGALPQPVGPGLAPGPGRPVHHVPRARRARRRPRRRRRRRGPAPPAAAGARLRLRRHVARPRPPLCPSVVAEDLVMPLREGAPAP